MSSGNNKITLTEIRQALLKEWDPIGIKEIPGAEGEYDGYALEILSLLRKPSTKHELFNHLWLIETEQMGLTGDRTATEKFVEKLVNRLAGG